MATNTVPSFTVHTGNNTAGPFAISFSYLDEAEVDVTVDGVLKSKTTHYIFATATTITFTSGNHPSNGAVIKFQRDTDISTKKVDFQDGSVLTEADLDNNSNQILFGLQEYSDTIENDLVLRDGSQSMTGTLQLEKNVNITFEGSSANANETTLTVANPTADRTITFPDATGNAVVDNATQTLTNKTIDSKLKVTDATLSTSGSTYSVTSGGYLSIGTSDSDALQIFKNGNTSFISEVGTGDLAIVTNGTNLYIQKDATAGHAEDMIHCIADGAVKLFYNGGTTPKLQTTNTGISIDGDITLDDLTIHNNHIRSENTQFRNEAGTSVQFSVDDIFVVSYKPFVPATDDSIDLGANNNQWKDLYLDGIGYIDTVNADDITGSAVITSGTSTSDTKIYSAKRAGEIFYGKDTLGEIQSGETWSAADNKVATTAAIDARIVDLVDDVGGFVPITNETSFPETNPDVNNDYGTLVSVPLANDVTSNSSGVINIPNGTVSTNTTVSILSAAANTTYKQGFGIIVETTDIGPETYKFHRYVPKATEVTTVAGNTTNINTVAGISANVTTVAGISSNVTTVAGISANVTTVANDGTDIGNVAGSIANVNTTAGSIANVNTTAASISNVNTVAGSISNVNTVAGISSNVTSVAGISSNVTTVANDGSDIGTVANSIANVNTAAGSISNVNTVAGSISNVNTVGSNITNVTNASTYLNNFLSLYLGQASSDPTVDGLGNALTEGDKYFNTVSKQIRVWNGQVWQGIAENTVEVAKFANATFSSVYTASAGSNSIDLGGLAVTGAVFSNESIVSTRIALLKGSGTFNLGGI